MTDVAVTFTWLCDHGGCYWQASSENREEAHTWATEHTDLKRHPVSLYIERGEDLLCVHCGNPAVVANLCAVCVERLSS